MPPISQGTEFIALSGLGLLLGALYDVCRLVRMIFHAGKLVSAIIDLFFWLACTGLIMLALYLFAGGELRFFLLLGCAIGALVYMVGISPLVMFIYKKISASLGKLGERPPVKKLREKLLK